MPKKLVVLLVCQIVFLGLLQSVSARTWEDKNGRKIEAELKSVDALTITLEHSSGKVVTIALSSLSSWDRQWVSDFKEAEKKDFEQTKKAAEQGDAEAQNNLGLMYYEGEGVSQDYMEAAKWYRLAAEQVKADLAKKMTPEQVARAQELSTELEKN
jgi:TPR repeat protein